MQKNGGKIIRKRSKNKEFKALGQWFLRGFLLLILVIMVFPLFMLAVNSLMGRQELLETCGAVLADYGENAGIRIFPMYPTLRAYVRLLLDSPEYFTAFWNSMIQTVGILAGQLLVAVPAAWAFARCWFPGKQVLWFLYMLLMILPFQVTMVSGYLVLNAADLMDTRAAVILPGIFSTLPVFILRKTFAGIPREILEAAQIDGAGSLGTFFYVGIPLGVPEILRAWRKPCGILARIRLLREIRTESGRQIRLSSPAWALLRTPWES